MSQLLDKAVDVLERKLFFDRLGARCGELRDDEHAWAEIVAERETEAGTPDDSSA